MSPDTLPPTTSLIVPPDIVTFAFPDSNIFAFLIIFPELLPPYADEFIVPPDTVRFVFPVSSPESLPPYTVAFSTARYS